MLEERLDRPLEVRGAEEWRADLVHPVVEGGEAYDNVVTGVLRGLDYVGSTVKQVVELANGAQIKLEQHESLTRHLVPRHGETLRVGWRASDARLLPN